MVMKTSGRRWSAGRVEIPAEVEADRAERRPVAEARADGVLQAGQAEVAAVEEDVADVVEDRPAQGRQGGQHGEPQLRVEQEDGLAADRHVRAGVLGPQPVEGPAAERVAAAGEEALVDGDAAHGQPGPAGQAEVPACRRAG